MVCGLRRIAMLSAFSAVDARVAYYRGADIASDFVKKRLDSETTSIVDIVDMAQMSPEEMRPRTNCYHQLRRSNFGVFHQYLVLWCKFNQLFLHNAP